MIEIDLLIEGALEEAVADRLLQEVGLAKGNSYGKSGWQYVRDHVGKYINAAPYKPFFVLVDLCDTGLSCAAEVRSAWLPKEHPNFLLRLPVRELEAWFLADRAGLAQFMSVSQDRIPPMPENVPDAKQELINIARHSRSKNIKAALVPAPGVGASQGILYTSEMSLFARNDWNVQEACNRSDSLKRCINRLKELKERLESAHESVDENPSED